MASRSSRTSRSSPAPVVWSVRSLTQGAAQQANAEGTRAMAAAGPSQVPDVVGSVRRQSSPARSSDAASGRVAASRWSLPKPVSSHPLAPATAASQAIAGSSLTAATTNHVAATMPGEHREATVQVGVGTAVALDDEAYEDPHRPQPGRPEMALRVPTRRCRPARAALPRAPTTAAHQ